MNPYYGVWGEAAAERTVERSRFVACIARTAGEEEAKAFLARLRAVHPLATHICYGYVADRLGNMQRFSDDGEPQGTAGMPILGVLKAKALCETTLAVVRYFGGIKLGAGGLTRAYASAAAEAVAAADVRKFEACTELTAEVSYAETDAALRFLEGREILSREFGEKVRLTVAVRDREKTSFTESLADALLGRVRVTEGETRYYPFRPEEEEWN